jgi:hypothetical protein
MKPHIIQESPTLEDAIRSRMGLRANKFAYDTAKAESEFIADLHRSLKPFIVKQNVVR